MSLTRTVQQIQQVMRRDPGLDGDAQRISQLSWLLFLRALDDASGSGENTTWPILPKDLRWSSWARDEDLSSKELLDFVNSKLLPELRNLRGVDEGEKLVREVFSGVRNYMTSGSLLREVLRHLDELLESYESSGDHLVGDVYEKILSDLQSAGNAGEFYTPKPITDLLVRLTGVKSSERVLDFACGTGGFLVSCLELLQRDVRKGRKKAPQLLGVEKKSVPHLLSVTNLLLHGYNPAGNVVHGNLLAKPFEEIGTDDLVDVILTNPPFGAMEEESVQQNFPPELRSKDTADLFVLLMTKLLKRGGRAAIILPDGFLFAGGVKKRLRQLLLSTCDVHTILRLPKGVFSPYTGIATNVLFLRKGEPTKSIWYYEQGTPSHLKSYSKTKPVQLEDFDPFVSWWNNKTPNDRSWQVEIEEIERNDFRLDCRNPDLAVPKIKVADALKNRTCALKNEGTAKKRLMAEIAKYSVGDAASIAPDALEVLCDTESGLQVLTRAVLALAMSGQLTNPPKRRTAVGSALIAAGFASAGSRPPEPDLKKQVPLHWEVMRLDQVAKIESGGTPRANDASNFSEGGVPWLTPADLYGLQEKYISRGKRNLSTKGLQSCSAKMLPAGTVLFSSRAPIGYLAIAKTPVATNQGFKSCVPFLPEMSEFLYYFLMHERVRIEQEAPGTTFKEVAGKHMKAVLIPLPSLEEQAKIVSLLDTLFGYVTQLRNRMRERLAAQRDAEIALDLSAR